MTPLVRDLVAESRRAKSPPYSDAPALE
jgi:hypothetical protein